MKSSPILFLCLLVILLVQMATAQSSNEKLYEQAYDMAQRQNKTTEANAINEKIIDRARAALDDQLHLEAAMAYLTRDKYGNPARIPLRYLDGFAAIADDIRDPYEKIKLWYYLSGQYFQQNKLNKGTELANRALSAAAASSDPMIKVIAYLASARSARYESRVKEAWQNILNAQNFLIECPASQRKIWKHAIEEEQVEFYSFINDYDKAVNVRQEQIQQIIDAEVVDSVDYFWKEYYLCKLLEVSDPNIPLAGRLNNILDFAKKKNQNMLRDYAKALSRGYFIKTNQLDEFYKAFAEDYKTLSDSSRRAEFCYGNALCFEHLNEFEKAKNYYQAAIAEAKKSSNVYRIANYYRQYGLFLHKNRMEKDAYRILDSALTLASSVDHTPYVLDVIKPLENMAQKNKDFEAAYRYNSIEQAANASSANEKIRENLLIMELNNDKRQNEIYLEKKKEKEKKKYNLQYFAIAVGLIILFLILVVVSSLKVPVWLVDMLGFFSILFIFEFIILILDHKIHHWAHGEPIKIFLVKILILSVLFPLHHVVEHSVLAYMKKNQLLKRPKRGFVRRTFETLYPWLRDKNTPDTH